MRNQRLKAGKMANDILVYIPCHTDLDQALNQAAKLRNDFKDYSAGLPKRFSRLEIVISVNDFEPTLEEKGRANKLCDQVYYYGNALLSDVNISQGFLIALQRQPELFWLLSANDSLVEGSLIRILREFENEPELDMVVANALGISTIYLENEILNPTPIGNHYGLISGVVYRTKRVGSYFNVAPFFPWTGWSQLAVIQSAIRGYSSLRVSTLPVERLFLMPKGLTQYNAKRYAHSFFGGLIQTLIFQETSMNKRRFLRSFVLKNFYLLHLFSERDAVTDSSSDLINTEHYLAWNQIIAESLLKSFTPVTYLFYKTMKKVPFEKGAKILFLRRIRDLLYPH